MDDIRRIEIEHKVSHLEIEISYHRAHIKILEETHHKLKELLRAHSG